MGEIHSRLVNVHSSDYFIDLVFLELTTFFSFEVSKILFGELHKPLEMTVKL